MTNPTPPTPDSPTRRDMIAVHGRSPRTAPRSPAMRSDTARLVLLLLASFVAAGRARAGEQEAPRPRPVDQARVRPYREVAISPDGKRVAWVEGLAEEGGGPSSRTAIYVVDLTNGGGAPRRITAGDGKSGHAEHSVAWSPDGDRLAFLSDRDKEG